MRKLGCRCSPAASSPCRSTTCTTHRHWPSGIVKVFVLCERLSGNFQANIETIRSGFFSPEELPPLATSKTTEAQVRMCLAAAKDAHWQPLFD